uniref:AlNc14C156G7645 protein n=1 Tax=Albugo laibachii Nc14 TaxID=890382 RepID=F0WME8_9STRA|nr:AlNc14C156G7645 [Albugo laibachii Nc14]|eukprot:CCA22480.1 AlNc14C156G7645 [Albugo laibachii Nc14]
MLSFFISDYKQKKRRDHSGKSRFQHLALNNGFAIQDGTKDDHKGCLLNWRRNSDFTYWFPSGDDFPNIDSIVKFTWSSGQSNVAYLQIIADSDHSIDAEQLKMLNAIFMSEDINNRERPIYIAVCPDPKTCESFKLKPTAQVRAVRKVCSLFVAYPPNPNSPIPRDRLSMGITSLPPQGSRSQHSLRKRQRPL